MLCDNSKGKSKSHFDSIEEAKACVYSYHEEWCKDKVVEEFEL